MRNKDTTLLSRWYREVWNENRKEVIDQLLAPNVKAHGIAPGDDPIGLDDFKIFYEDFRNQFDNINITVNDVIAQDDMESAQCAATATHKATGKNVSFSGMSMARIEDGKIAEAWNNFDFMKMYQQLGYTLAPQ